jgi:hypothetical protein
MISDQGTVSPGESLGRNGKLPRASQSQTYFGEQMKRLLLLLVCALVPCGGIHAAEFDSLEGIGDVTDYSTTATGVVFNCRDGSQVQITVLAADLVRVRA